MNDTLDTLPGKLKSKLIEQVRRDFEYLKRKIWAHMANHHAGRPKSVMSCGQLFEALRQEIPGLQIKHNDNLCSLWSTGTVIAWASSVRIWGGMQVWFVGESQTIKKFPALTIPLKIKPISGMWGDCCGSFRISNDTQLAEAVELLLAISYPLSLKWASNKMPLAIKSQPRKMHANDFARGQTHDAIALRAPGSFFDGEQALRGADRPHVEF